MDTLIGFDSAWTDNAKAPGAICAVRVQGEVAVEWWPPELVSFSGALDFVRRVRSVDGVTLVALDQPTIVPNAIGLDVSRHGFSVRRYGNADLLHQKIRSRRAFGTLIVRPSVIHPL